VIWSGSWVTRRILPDRTVRRRETTVLVACLGDLMLDVLVHAPGGLVPDDDTPARITLQAGGQAANVAAWVTVLGGRARVCGPRSDTAPGRLVEEALTERGVELCTGPDGRIGTVMSLTSTTGRSMASDPGDLTWLEHLEPGPWLEGADWLYVSGYALLQAPDPQRVVRTAAVARDRGARVAVDLASASMVTRFGASEFARLCQDLRPTAVFANDAEWAACPVPSEPGGRTVLVLKHGPKGATFVIDGVPDDRLPEPGPVVDVTGAGDALTAGFLVGGTDLAMHAAASCVAVMGGQPPREQP
jgi:ribokinase